MSTIINEQSGEGGKKQAKKKSPCVLLFQNCSLQASVFFQSTRYTTLSKQALWKGWTKETVPESRTKYRVRTRVGHLNNNWTLTVQIFWLCLDKTPIFLGHVSRPAYRPWMRFGAGGSGGWFTLHLKLELRMSNRSHLRKSSKSNQHTNTERNTLGACVWTRNSLCFCVVRLFLERLTESRRHFIPQCWYSLQVRRHLMLSLGAPIFLKLAFGRERKKKNQTNQKAA